MWMGGCGSADKLPILRLTSLLYLHDPEGELTDHQMGLAGLILSIIGAIGVLLTIYFYFRSKPLVKLSYRVKHSILIAEQNSRLPGEIKITYNGFPITELKRTHVTLWNSGRQAIRRSDIVTKSPLRVEIPNMETHILRAQIIKRVLLENDVHIRDSRDHGFRIDFEYLEPSHGVTIEILYKGSAEHLFPTGQIVNMPSGLRRVSSEDTAAPYLWLVIPSFFGLLLIFQRSSDRLAIWLSDGHRWLEHLIPAIWVIGPILITITLYSATRRAKRLPRQLL